MIMKVKSMDFFIIFVIIGDFGGGKCILSIVLFVLENLIWQNGLYSGVIYIRRLL